MFSLARLFSAYRLMQERYTAEISALNTVIQELKGSHQREIETLNARHEELRADKERDWEQRVRTEHKLRDVEQEFRDTQNRHAQLPPTAYEKKRIADIQPAAIGPDPRISPGGITNGGYVPLHESQRKAQADSLLRRGKRAAIAIAEGGELTPEQRRQQIQSDAERFHRTGD